MTEALTISAALAEGRQQLSLSNSESATIDAEVLLAHSLASSRTFLHTRPETILLSAQRRHYRQLIERRVTGEPVAYLTGHREFWSLPVMVNSHTLIPRPETELLVELALPHCAGAGNPAIADLGTGSGAIALAIAEECPRCRISAVDASSHALVVAEANARRLGYRNIEFLCGDWFSPLAGKRFDVIVSNPPYVREGDPHLSAGDLRFEPVSTLVAGHDGLDAIRLIVEQAPGFLVDGGWLLIEHGHDQGAAVAAIFSQHGFREVSNHNDYAGHQRAVAGQWYAE